MRIRVFEGFKFKRKDTYFYKLDPRVKLLFLAYSLFLTLYFSTFLPLLLLFLLSLVLVLLNRALKEWWGTLRMVFVLSAIIFLLNFFFSERGNKVNYASAMTLRFLTLTSFFSLFFLTTPPEELSDALVLLGIPYEYTFMFMMAMRFIPTLARDLQTIIDAQRSRGLELERGGIFKRVKRLIPLLVPLIVLEIRRSVVVAEALEARAFGASKRRTLTEEYGLRRAEYCFLAWTTILTVALIVLSRLPQTASIFGYRLPEIP